MFFKNLIFSLFVLASLTINAQDDFSSQFDEAAIITINDYDLAKNSLDLSNISESYRLAHSANSLDGSDFSITSPTSDSYMFLKAEGSDELDHSLSMMLRKRHPMEKTGRILTYIGVPLAIIGGIMVSGADELYYECTNGNCSGDARGGFGVVALAAGVGLSGTGTVLWILGSKKR